MTSATPGPHAGSATCWNEQQLSAGRATFGAMPKWRSPSTWSAPPAHRRLGLAITASGSAPRPIYLPSPRAVSPKPSLLIRRASWSFLTVRSSRETGRCSRPQSRSCLRPDAESSIGARRKLTSMGKSGHDLGGAAPRLIETWHLLDRTPLWHLQPSTGVAVVEGEHFPSRTICRPPTKTWRIAARRPHKLGCGPDRITAASPRLDRPRAWLQLALA